MEKILQMVHLIEKNETFPTKGEKVNPGIPLFPTLLYLIALSLQQVLKPSFKNLLHFTL